MLTSPSVDDLVSMFNSLFLSVWDQVAPTRTRHYRRRNTPWMTDQILDLIHRRQTAYKTFLQSRSDDDHTRYKVLRQQVHRYVRNSKRQFFCDIAQKGGKIFWDNIRLCSGLGRVKSRVLPLPAMTPEQSLKSANTVNSHFVNAIKSIATTTNNATANCVNDVHNVENNNMSIFSFSPITDQDVLTAIKQLNNSKSRGIDNISIKMVKLSGNIIAPILRAIFNHFLSTGYYPQQWKEAIVTPVFKKGDKFCINNYRPVALLPICSKIFERLVLQQFSCHISNNNILSQKKHGFIKGKSCESALLRLSNLLFNAKRQKQHSLLVAIDYTKAFDTLNLPILLSSLRSSGIEEVAFSWFKSYLCGPLQRTKYASRLSDALALDYGVPEGCIISPLLFNLYLNGLLQQLPFDGFVAYADDLTLAVSNDNIQLLFARMQELLNFICSWSTSHGISISTSKCYGMFLDYAAKPHNSPDIQLFMDGKQLQFVSELKILGVTFSQSLNWHNHVSNIRAKIASMTGILQRLGGDLDMKSHQSKY